MVTLALEFFLFACFRYRVVARIFASLANALEFNFHVPCFSTVRLWLLRLGLYRLQSASLGPRWALICDHTATYSGQKLFVVCGVDLDQLERRIADGKGDYNLTQSDLQPLAIVPMSHSFGEHLLRVYEQIIARHGNPQWMITDGGSDIVKSARLLREHQEAKQQQPTQHVYDLSHRIARIVQAELLADPDWKDYEQMVTDARMCFKYKLRQLSPPSLRHGPDRWMNLCGIVGWHTAMLELRDKREAISQEAAERGQPAQQNEKPRFGLTPFVWEQENESYNKPDGHYHAIEKLCGREYADESAYIASLVAKRPSLPEEIIETLKANSDLNEVYLKKILLGSDKVERIHNEVKGMLAFNNDVQKHLKAKGLAKSEIAVCEQMLAGAELEGVGQRVGERVLVAIKDMAANLKEGERIIVTSDIIESINGSWKIRIAGSPTPAIGGNALLMAALMGTLSMAETKLALETVSVEAVTTWTSETFGETFHTERQKIRSKKSPPNTRENEGGI